VGTYSDKDRILPLDLSTLRANSIDERSIPMDSSIVIHEVDEVPVLPSSREIAGSFEDLSDLLRCVN
jgi:hypothetical protein